MRVDVTVSGGTFSGDGLEYLHSSLPAAFAEDNYMDYIVDATFALYTVVQKVNLLCTGVPIRIALVLNKSIRKFRQISGGHHVLPRYAYGLHC